MCTDVACPSDCLSPPTTSPLSPTGLPLVTFLQLPDVDLFHRLKLYGDDKAAEEGAPVVSETYDELVISEPTWVLWERVCTLQKKPAPHSDVLPLTLHHR